MCKKQDFTSKEVHLLTRMLVALLMLLCFCVVRGLEHKVVKDWKGNYYLSYNHQEYLRPLADNTTVSSLGFDPSSVSVVDDAYLKRFKRLPAFDTLKMKDASANETLRVMVTKALILSPTVYIKESYHFEKINNPSIVVIGDKILMFWRTSVYKSSIKFAWLNQNSMTFMPTDFSRFGIKNFMIADFPHFDWNRQQEDPRLLVLPDSKELYVQYHAKQGKTATTVLCIVPLKETRINEKQLRVRSMNALTAGTGIGVANYSYLVFDSYDRKAYPNFKNWVMFHHAASKRVLFIENINPLHIVEPIRSPDVDTNHNLSVRSVVYSKERIRLPWLNEYDSLIRGGSPAILVPTGNGTSQVYLSFFHTAVKSREPRFYTYFMGAFTFCPEIPFNVHSMSSVPIVPSSSFYEGPPVKAGIMDYVVFPLGLVLLDKETILMSFGSQDRDGNIVKMSLPGLLASLDLVQECR